MSAPSLFERDLGRAIRAEFGSETKVVRFGDDDAVNDCFIVSGADFPVKGVTSYCSVGLSRHSQRAGATNVKVEILAACASITPHVDNLLASCVFDSVKNGSSIIYGARIPDIVSQYGISGSLRHLTFVAPFLWPELNRLEVEGQAIHCLMMLLISDSELAYLESHGIEALEALFDEHQIDIFDINRQPVIS
jgi:antitoxin YqcF